MEDELGKEERRLATEHRDMLLNLRAILETQAGQSFFKYLYKHFDVAQVPELGLEGVDLHDRLGFMRAGNSIFKIVSEANHQTSAKLLAEIEKERYEQIYADAKIGRN